MRLPASLFLLTMLTGANSQRPMSVAWYDATAEMVAAYPVSAIPWSNLTHIVYNGGFQPFRNGTLAMGQDRDCTPSGCTSSWICGESPADCVETLHAVRDAAHAHGVKVLIGGLDLFEGNTSLAYTWLNSTCPSSPHVQHTFGASRPCIEVYANSIASFVSRHGIDGCEFDFEDFGDCSLEEMHCPPDWADSPWMDRYALKQFARLHRLTRGAMGPSATMGIDLSTSGTLFTSNDTATVACFDYFTTMLYSVGQKGFEADKASISAFINEKGLPKSKVLFGNGLQHSIKGVDLSKCGPLKPTDNSCGSQMFNGQALSEARTRWAINNGFGGGFFFELNDDLLPNNSFSTMRWYLLITIAHHPKFVCFYTLVKIFLCRIVLFAAMDEQLWNRYAQGLVPNSKSDDNEQVVDATVMANVHAAPWQLPPHATDVTVYALRPYES